MENQNPPQEFDPNQIVGRSQQNGVESSFQTGGFSPVGKANIQSPIASQSGQAIEVPEIEYAGFWIRVAAYFIDAFVVIILNTIVGVVFFFIGGIDFLKSIEKFVNFLALVTMFLYYILMTNRYQATLGKMLVGIRVCSEDISRASLIKIIIRESLGKLISGIILSIGYIMAGFTERKRALHDMMAGTVVIYKNKKSIGKIIAIVVISFIVYVIAMALILTPAALVIVKDLKNTGQNIYKNTEHGYFLTYTSDWKVFENKQFAGPLFLPKNFDENQLKEGKEVVLKDICILSVMSGNVPKSSGSPCKDNYERDIILGNNKFTVCNYNNNSEYGYRIIDPSNKYVLVFGFKKDDSCKAKVEKVISTLKF